MMSVPFSPGGKGRGRGRDSKDLAGPDEYHQTAVSSCNVEIVLQLRATVIENFGCRLHIAFPIDDNRGFRIKSWSRLRVKVRLLRAQPWPEQRVRRKRYS